MIERYGDHAANERTLLAWLRTGIAVVAFGFVVEKFKVFVAIAAKASDLDDASRLQLEKLASSATPGAGQWLVLLGIVFMVMATFRFYRTARRIDDQKLHTAGLVVDIASSAILAALLAASSGFLLLR